MLRIAYIFIKRGGSFSRTVERKCTVALEEKIFLYGVEWGPMVITAPLIRAGFENEGFRKIVVAFVFQKTIAIVCSVLV